jgi:hypothetical protein
MIDVLEDKLVYCGHNVNITIKHCEYYYRKNCDATLQY